MNSNQPAPAHHADTDEHLDAGSPSPGAEPDSHARAAGEADDAGREQAIPQPVEPLEGYERL